MAVLTLVFDISGPSGKSSCSFGAEGGTIGRAGGNQLHLDDPERTVSGRHASIGLHNGRFYLTDTSSNGTVFNDSRVMRRGDRVQLSSGDRLRIGPFELTARIAEQAAAVPLPGQPAVIPPVALPPEPAPGPIDPLAGLASPTPPVDPRIPDGVDFLSQPAPVVERTAPQARWTDQAVAEVGLRLALPDQPAEPDALVPVALRAEPIAFADGLPAEIAAFLDGLGVRPPAALPADRAAALGRALAALVDRSAVGADWRHPLAAGDAAGLACLIAASRQPEMT